MKTLREMMDLIEAAQQENLSEDGIESWAGNPSDRRHSGHESYMTPEYMLAHYKKRLAQIAAGKHKYPKEVAQLQAKIAKLEKQGVTEMDKSGPQPGRDGRVSHSTYGSRDKGGSKGPEREAQPITAKKVAQDALDILKKQGVAEEQLEETTPDAMAKIDDLFRK